MKYQSEIIKDIIENNGHHVTTNPHYEVDCINEIINDVRGSYPKLCDYMGEWMNYANEHMGIGKFPTERVTDVTNARFENVVPYGYKSAILKGQTFINIISTISTKNYKYIDYNISFIDKTKRYFIKYESTIPVNEIGFIADNNTWNYVVNVNDLTDGYVIIKPNENKEIEKLRIRFNNADSINPSLNVVCIEYQTDMENWDIPYFTGMQSVKMPVLTTSNEDGTKTNILTVNEDVELGSVGEVKDELNLLTGQLTQRTETRAYQEGDEANSEVITDMANTRYKLPKESIKTVDLTCLDENNTPTKFKPYEGVMYVQTSSETLPPLLDMEVPVEAINQNLASFIK